MTGQVLSADGVVGESGLATIVYNVRLNPAAAESTAALHDGTANTDPQLWEMTASAGTAKGPSVGDSFDGGLYFPNGCYVDLTGAAATLAVSYEQNG